jgi:branched-chain amino acid transport system substrate-binding protein
MLSRWHARRRALRTAVGGLALLTAAALTLAGCTSSAPKQKASSLSLTIGALLPQTGSFAALAPAEAAGIQLAANDINTAGLGITVKVDYADSGDTSTATAAASVTALEAKHVTAIVGPSSNDVTKAIIGGVTGAGIVMVSPQNSSPEFTTAKDYGLYFRTSPSDDAQGVTLAKLMARDGATRLGIITLADDYGMSMQTAVAASFEKTGGKIVAQKTFVATDADISAQIAAVVKAKPDAVAILTLGQAVTVAPALIAAGIPASHLYFTDRDLLQYGTSMPVPLTGAQGTAAGPVLDAFFKKNLLGVDPTLTTFAYAPESYDAVVLLALASLAAGSTAGAKIAGKLRAVSGGTGHGEKATDFASAAQIILAGDPVDYDGYSGGIAFDRHGDPTKAVIGVFRYGADNMFTRRR